MIECTEAMLLSVRLVRVANSVLYRGAFPGGYREAFAMRSCGGGALVLVEFGVCEKFMG